MWKYKVVCGTRVDEVFGQVPDVPAGVMWRREAAVADGKLTCTCVVSEVACTEFESHAGVLEILTKEEG